jgi:hypothetical protein
MKGRRFGLRSRKNAVTLTPSPSTPSKRMAADFDRRARAKRLKERRKKSARRSKHAQIHVLQQSSQTHFRTAAHESSPDGQQQAADRNAAKRSAVAESRARKRLQLDAAVRDENTLIARPVRDQQPHDARAGPAADAVDARPVDATLTSSRSCTCGRGGRSTRNDRSQRRFARESRIDSFSCARLTLDRRMQQCPLCSRRAVQKRLALRKLKHRPMNVSVSMLTLLWRPLDTCSKPNLPAPNVCPPRRPVSLRWRSPPQVRANHELAFASVISVDLV